jgi:hypothetical protein
MGAMKLSPVSLLFPRSLACAALLLTSALALPACDADESSSALLRAYEGSEPSPAPTPCGDAVELPANAVMVDAGTDRVVVSTGFEDPQALMSGATSWEYSCSCTGGSGACQVQVVGGSYVQCYSKSCTKCELVVTKGSALTALAHLAGSCDPLVLDEGAATARADQVTSWAADLGYPEPIYSEDGLLADAPAGYGLVVEVVGGRMLTYTVPEEHFDTDGELTSFVGPTNAGPEVIAQAAGGTQLGCACEGSGDCSFQQSGLCSGLCETSGNQRGCVVTSKKKLTPIK